MGTETYYDQQYWSDGNRAVIEMLPQMVRQGLGPVISTDSVLDHRCGLAFACQRQLHTVGRHYVEVDFSSMAVEIARSKGLEPVRVNLADGTICFESDTLDGVVCFEVFEHLFAPLSAARELNRVCWLFCERKPISGKSIAGSNRPMNLLPGVD